ncbi:hypothetical protein [uncultured Bacteroides sp.]|uniref:hypothetical protein n=1 Tax=uncultured Bacteroides sp. TaxID=162156 RepID=UPI0025DEA2EF|nr:hypothetical protein [uncultured Bacteroides sp.]
MSKLDEPSGTVVTNERLKMLTSLDQNGKRSDNLSCCEGYTDKAPPADGRTLTRSIVGGRNLVSPYISYIVNV